MNIFPGGSVVWKLLQSFPNILLNHHPAERGQAGRGTTIYQKIINLMYHTQPSATVTKPSQIHSFYKIFESQDAFFLWVLGSMIKMWSIDADNIDVSNIAPSSLLTLSNAINNQSTSTIWRKTVISINGDPFVPKK